MAALPDLPLDGLSPSKLWSALGPELRALAGRAVYSADDRSARNEVDQAIADAIRFREVAVRRLPLDKRVDYLSRVVRPDDDLATTLLLALHLEHRRPLLAAFLDHLEIPHNDGIIHEDHQPSPPSPEALRPAVNRLLGEFRQDEVEIYLASLLAMDDNVWGGLLEIVSGLCEEEAT